MPLQMLSSIDRHIFKEFLTSSQPLSSKQPLEALEFYLFTLPHLLPLLERPPCYLLYTPDISYTGQQG